MRFCKKMKILQELMAEYEDNVKLVGTSQSGLRPGDIVMFNYGTPRFGLVVKSNRAPNGSFLSTRNNLLLNVFLMERLSLPMLSIVINILYKDRNRCSYKDSTRILGSFFRKDSFRTFNVVKALSIVKIEINK